MDTWIIDKSLWKKSELEWKYFFLLYLLYNQEYDNIRQIYEKEEDTNFVEHYLEYNNYIRLGRGDWEEVILTSKGKEVFKSSEEINFDEFFEAFPVKTPSGRSLRPSNKEWSGELTKDYTEAKKKYLSAVKSKEIHNKIVSIIKAKASKCLIKDKEFENNIITYINQRIWQKDCKYLDKSTQTVNRI